MGPTLQGKTGLGKRGALKLAVLLMISGTSLCLPYKAHATSQAQAAVSASHVIAAQDKATLTLALESIRAGKWSQADYARDKLKDPLAIKIYDWFYYTKKGGHISFDKISTFIKKNPDWPSQGLLKTNAEKAMPASLSNASIIAWFDSHSPQTVAGMDRYLRALMATGAQQKAATTVNEWWRKASLSTQEQSDFLKRYRSVLTKQSEVARFGTLLMRKQYTNARQIARILGNGYPELAEARIALAEGSPGVNAFLAKVPARLQDDPGLLYERLRWRRRNNMDFGAIEILHKMPPVAIIPNPEEWWKERHIMVRRLIEQKQFKSAYLLTKNHQLKSGAGFAEGEFLAGWLALRRLKKPWEAFEHFERLYHGTETPMSRSRGAYWAGKASDALGHKDIAREWYMSAAKYQTVFYGQMALQELPVAERPRQQTQPERTFTGQQAFEKRELVQAVRLIHAARLREATRSFLNAIGDSLKTPEEYRLAADLADDLNQRFHAIQIAKKAANKGVILLDQSFPTLLNFMKPVETEWAFVHGVIRQESAFDEDARSPVGASGLMQLMPATAREVAKKNNISLQGNDLTANPAKNVRLGSLYLSQMIRRYDGSYVLAAAAYNAGPGRVDGWLRENGDPRKGEIDLIDWIEIIPVAETRNYVQRVLEAVYIYRQRLKGVQKTVNAPIHVRTQ